LLETLHLTLLAIATWAAILVGLVVIVAVPLALLWRFIKAATD
jgi:hypothetical protein